MGMIGKLETMSDDLNYLSDKFPVLSPLVADSAKVNSANSEEYKKYLKQLTEGQMSSLCSLYREDFEMFGYDCDI